MTLSVPSEFQDDDIPQVKPIESGVYDCIVMSTSWENYARIPDVQYLMAELKITGGSGDGQKVWCRFNINHPSKNAQKFSWALLKQLAAACGQDANSGEIDPTKFDGAKVRCRINVSEHDDYGTQLDAKKFMPQTPRLKQQSKTAAEIDSDLPW